MSIDDDDGVVSWESMRRDCGSQGSRRRLGLLCSRPVCSSRTKYLASFSSTPEAAGVTSELLVQDICPQGKLVFIALGGNVVDRVQNLSHALECMRQAGIQVVRHACLYESDPAYVTDQPFYLNSAVAAVTKLSPDELLKTLKQIESEIGRNFGGLRYGPRPVDLDIIFYANQTVNTETLQIPHPRCMERPFVMAPLVSLLTTRDLESPNHWSKHTAIREDLARAWSEIGGEASVEKEGLRTVFPVGRKLLEWAGRTHIMGILNFTPDSFSDEIGHIKTEDENLELLRNIPELRKVLSCKRSWTYVNKAFEERLLREDYWIAEDGR